MRKDNGSTVKGRSDGRVSDNMDSRTVYVIGDVHGCHDLLVDALKWIRADRDSRGTPGRLIMLGDYIDRGPASRQVIETLMHDVDDLDPIFLRGNHEDMMLRTLRDQNPVMAGGWYMGGGRRTLESYGWSPADGLNFSMIPKEHIDFLASLPLYHEDADRIYVHAGLRPGIPLEKQDPDELLWIRTPFLCSDAWFGKLVVHGHTPCEDGMPEIMRNRINLDTGAFWTGHLTCAAFDPQMPMPRFFRTVRRIEPEMSVVPAAAGD